MQVAILGAGRMGLERGRGVIRSGLGRVAAVVDSIPERAQSLAAELGTMAMTAEAALATPEIQAAFLCLPHGLHRSVTVQAAAAGKHVFCEKPIATSLAEARAMIEACEQAGVRLMIGHTHRYWPENVVAKKLIDAGRIGLPVSILDTIYKRGLMAGYPEWYRQQEQAGGGVFMNHTIHSVDRVRWWMGDEVARVYAAMGTFVLAGLPVEDNGAMTLTFRSGRLATLQTSWTTPDPLLVCRAEIIGTTGIIEVNTWGGVRLWGDGAAGWSEIAVPKVNGFDAETAAFLRWIAVDEPPALTADDAYRDLECVLGAYRSAASGLPAELPLREG